MYRLSLALLLLIGAACSGGGGGESPPPPAAKASLTVVNSTTLSITGVYMSPASSGSWGLNQLTSSIVPGASRTIANISAGLYDLRAVANDGSYIERFGVQLTQGGLFTWTLTASAGSLKVVNNYAYPITELYVASSTSSTWGGNQLSAPIPVGGSLTLTNIPAGAYDLRAVGSDGAYVENYDVSITAGGLFTWTLSVSTGALKVVNNYNFPITELYVASSTSSTWGANQLSAPIPVGGSITLTDIPEGMYDLRAVASDAAYVENYDVSITAGELFTWTLSPAPEATGSLKVVNNYNYPITELYVASSSSSTWGANQLSAPIPVGGSFTLTDIPEDTYDLAAVASDGAYVENYGVSITAGGLFTWTLSPAATGSLKVVNNYTYPITELYVASSTSTTWGSNQLTAPIPVGGSFTLTNIPAGTYDLKAVAADGAYVENYGVSITAGGLFTWTLSPSTGPTTGSLTVVNNYSYPITALYVTPSSSTTWGVNQLSAPIPVGGSFTLTDIPPDTYDFAADASNGVYWERYGQAIAAGSLFTWTLVP
jgi:hypothetical protein